MRIRVPGDLVEMEIATDSRASLALVRVLSVLSERVKPTVVYPAGVGHRMIVENDRGRAMVRCIQCGISDAHPELADACRRLNEGNQER